MVLQPIFERFERVSISYFATSLQCIAIGDDDGVIPAYQVFPKESSTVRTASESTFYSYTKYTKWTVCAAPIILVNYTVLCKALLEIYTTIHDEYSRKWEVF